VENIQPNTAGSNGDPNQYVIEVIQRADQELRHLMAERAELTKRIGTVKRTMMGLAKLFGDDSMDTILLTLVDRKRGPRQPGITGICRRVLMEAQRPMSVREVCDEIQRTAPPLLASHKDPMATINTILARLVAYGEAKVSPGDHGQRVWLWVAERDPGLDQLSDRKGNGSLLS
jgi:chorismate mutase